MHRFWRRALTVGAIVAATAATTVAAQASDDYVPAAPTDVAFDGCI